MGSAVGSLQVSMEGVSSPGSALWSWMVSVFVPPGWLRLGEETTAGRTGVLGGPVQTKQPVCRALNSEATAAIGLESGDATGLCALSQVTQHN